MGMFDCVNYECTCPVCHEKVASFQSKDKECLLDTIEPADVDNFYTFCGKCGCWIEFDRVDKINFRRTVDDKDNKAMRQHTKILAL